MPDPYQYNPAAGCYQPAQPLYPPAAARPKYYRIHPGIGVARMGNSNQFFIGPETPGVPANSDSSISPFRSFRDGMGRILRQGARFRVYEYTMDNNGIFNNPREVSVGGDVVDIEWRVHLANRKSSFFVFHGQFGAEDNYIGRSTLPPGKIIKNDPDRTNLRNANIPYCDRTNWLDIDPGEQFISTRWPGPRELNNPKPHIPIKSLGTLQLDELGRLIVLGGYGESNSWQRPPLPITEYASNDTWFDDASDGSIKARVRFRDGSAWDADAAWVMVGPPDFAPSIGNVVSLYDTIWDIAVRQVDLSPGTPWTPWLGRLREQKNVWRANGGRSLTGYRPSFFWEIYPLIKRAVGVRDVHVSGTGNNNYHRTMFDFAKLAALTGPLAADGAGLRKYIFGLMRDPDDPQVKYEKMPRGLGDNYTALDEGEPTPNSFFSLTRIQYAVMREWASNRFINDWPGNEPIFLKNPNPTPDDLDRAAAENSVGGPFFPGIDVSWLIRAKEVYAEPLRFKIQREPEGERPYYPLRVGALEFRSGFFSQQMALPWQADFYDCHKEREEDPDGNEFYFMWWAAYRPDDVFPFGKNIQERWVRKFDAAKTTDEPDDPQNFERFAQMQKRWAELKFVIGKRDNHLEEEP